VHELLIAESELGGVEFTHEVMQFLVVVVDEEVLQFRVRLLGGVCADEDGVVGGVRVCAFEVIHVVVDAQGPTFLVHHDDVLGQLFEGEKPLVCLPMHLQVTVRYFLQTCMD
jgi:hypothetical protein